MLVDRNKVIAGAGWGGSTWASTSYPFELQAGGDLTTPHHIDLENNTGLDATRFSNLVPASVGYMNLNTGTGFPPTGLNWGWQYTPLRADFDMDSNIDVVLQDSATDLKIWSLNEPAQVNYLPFNPGASGGTWRVVGSGDIDMDGGTDLFFQNDDGFLGYWTLNSTWLKSAGLLNPSLPGGSWKVVGVGDFNNDKQPDLLFQDTTGYLAVWYMDGINLTTAVQLSPNYPGNYWRAVGTGDFDHDGMVDILFQSAADASLAVWYMNGVTHRSAKLLTPMYPDNLADRCVTPFIYHTAKEASAAD